VFGHLKRTEKLIDAIVQRAAFVALAGMIAVITLQIVSRVFFNAVSWSEELARYLLVWTSFLGAAMAWQRGRHIAVDFVVNALPGPLRLAVKALAIVVAIGFFALIIFYGLRFMQMQSFQMSASLRIPIRYVFSIIPVCALLMLYYSLLDLAELFSASARREAEAIEAGTRAGEAP